MNAKLLRGLIAILALASITISTFAQEITFQNQKFSLHNVKAAIVMMDGKPVLQVERDLAALPFDLKNLGKTVDEPTFVKLENVDLANGIIEVKMLSRIQTTSSFEQAQGFIGVAFRINENNAAFESIYLRPKAGSSENQFNRNHTVQYFAYPDFKFDKLRTELNGAYETYADVGLNEWITMRIEIKDSKAALYINGQKRPSFIVEKMKGGTTNGQIALWVDIATVGYFKDLKYIKQ